MSHDLSFAQFDAAVAAIDSDQASRSEKAEMLMEVAMGMQTRPKTPEQLHRAIALYERALELCDADQPLLCARIGARLATALQMLPDGGIDNLYRAQSCLDAALPVLRERGGREEAAEGEMNLGLIHQWLAGSGRAKIQDAIQYYHRALRVFTREAYPQEFAILHNNIATAYLALPVTDERARMREALAVQSFEEVLKVVNIVDHPSEYAMVQNNLGNALQYVSTSHVYENNLRALDAYDEALKVRNIRDTPIEYAKTIANKANVLRNLPRDPVHPESGRRGVLQSARHLYEQAHEIFCRFGQADGAALIDESLAEVVAELESESSSRPHQAASSNLN